MASCILVLLFFFCFSLVCKNGDRCMSAETIPVKISDDAHLPTVKNPDLYICRPTFYIKPSHNFLMSLGNYKTLMLLLKITGLSRMDSLIQFV